MSEYNVTAYDFNKNANNSIRVTSLKFIVDFVPDNVFTRLTENALVIYLKKE